VRELCKKVNLLEPINADKIHITRDHYFKDAYLIDLPLDRAPDHAWQDIFDREWRSSRRMWDRKLYLMGDKLRLIATTNQLEDKLTWVRQVIEHTNKEIDAYNRTTPIEKQLKKQPFDEDKTTIETIREILRKGFPTATR
jgi:hypothetical protein